MSGIPEITAYPLPTAQQLPANLARWSLEPRRAVLLVHDMQRYFLRPLPESLRAGLVANAARLRRWCVEQGVQIAYTAQPGSMTEEQRGLLKDFWGPGMRASPADREVVEELAPGPDDWLLTKWRYSAFFHSDLLQRMRAAGRDQLRLWWAIPGCSPQRQDWRTPNSRSRRSCWCMDQLIPLYQSQRFTWRKVSSSVLVSRSRRTYPTV